jgi:hypothetical protein
MCHQLDPRFPARSEPTDFVTIPDVLRAILYYPSDKRLLSCGTCSAHGWLSASRREPVVSYRTALFRRSQDAFFLAILRS